MASLLEDKDLCTPFAPAVSESYCGGPPDAIYLVGPPGHVPSGKLRFSFAAPPLSYNQNQSVYMTLSDPPLSSLTSASKTRYNISVKQRTSFVPSKSAHLPPVCTSFVSTRLSDNYLVFDVPLLTRQAWQHFPVICKYLFHAYFDRRTRRYARRSLRGSFLFNCLLTKPP